MLQAIRDLVAQHGRLPVPIDRLSDDANLYKAGLTSFAAVQLMLAVEDAFDVEFSESQLTRRSFSSIDAMAACVRELVAVEA